VVDDYTGEIAKDVGDFIYGQLGLKPHIIIINCARYAL